MSTMRIIEPEESVCFRVGGREFHVILRDDGRLHVIATGRGNGRLFVLPESNTSVSLFTEKPGHAPSPHE